MEEIQATPWYRQFWPWFIMVPPAASVIGGFLTFFLAGGEPSMVVDDYGRIAMATEQRAERARHAEELGLAARIMLDSDPSGSIQQVTLTLTQRAGAGDQTGDLVLKLIHPLLEEQDLTILLTGSRGQYVGRLERPPGRYYVSLTDLAGTWRLTGELTAGTTLLELSAGAQTR
jgi:hypothetical protein